MSRLSHNAVDAAIPELRTQTQLRDLERRIADLERRSSAGDSATVTSGGPWGTAVPGATSGTSFVIPRSGIYLCVGSMTAWSSTSTGLNFVEWYIDGVIQKSNPKWNNNTAHQTWPSHMWVQSLSEGTHYSYVRNASSTNLTSDTNDRAYLIAVRLGA